MSCLVLFIDLLSREKDRDHSVQVVKNMIEKDLLIDQNCNHIFAQTKATKWKEDIFHFVILGVLVADYCTT